MRFPHSSLRKNVRYLFIFSFTLPAGEKRRASSVPERGLHEVPGRQGRRPKTVLPFLRHPVGRVFAHYGHHVRVRRVRRYAVLQWTSQGVYSLNMYVFNLCVRCVCMNKLGTHIIPNVPHSRYLNIFKTISYYSHTILVRLSLIMHLCVKSK